VIFVNTGASKAALNLQALKRLHLHVYRKKRKPLWEQRWPW